MPGSPSGLALAAAEAALPVLVLPLRRCGGSSQAGRAPHWRRQLMARQLGTRRMRVWYLGTAQVAATLAARLPAWLLMCWGVARLPPTHPPDVLQSWIPPPAFLGAPTCRRSTYWAAARGGQPLAEPHSPFSQRGLVCSGVPRWGRVTVS